MTFGQKLKQLMRENGITQRQLSHELNIAVSTLNGYANDNREPDFYTLCSLASYFHVSTDYLLDYSNAPKDGLPILDSNGRLLLHYYNKLSPEMKCLLLAQAKLLVEHDSENIPYE